MAAPTTLPEFAKLDTANISEPINDLKNNGWADGDYPSAKNWNWFAHWVSKWIAHLKQPYTELVITTVAVGFGTPPAVVMTVRKWDDGTVELHCPTFEAASDGNTMGIDSVTKMPTEYRDGNGIDIDIPVSIIADVGSAYIYQKSVAGIFKISGLDGTMFFLMANASGQYRKDIFPGVGNSKGVSQFSFRYKV